MRLLVGIDEREGGLDALELARVLSTGEESSALVASVLFRGPLPLSYVILPEEEAAAAKPRFAAARDRLAGLELETRAYGGGSPAGILTKLSEHEPFDAIVVGSSHRGPLGRAIAGSVAGNLLNGAPTDVAVAPKGYAQTRRATPQTIGVGYDGSPESELALRRAEAFARRFGANLRIVTVVTPAVAVPAMAPGVYAPPSPPEPEQVIAAGLESVGEGMAASSMRLDGDPATELARACEDEIDLLLLGSRGYGPVARVLLGSVSRQLLTNVAAPVIVVSRP